MSRVKVSVVMPVYNSEQYLNESLKDVTGQTLREIEIICVDDGSTDCSRDIIQQWKRRDDRIRLVTQENQYAGVARNNGLKYAQGKYVIFWDADDRFDIDALSHMYEKSEQTKADICICAADRFDDSGNVYNTDAYLLKQYLPEIDPFNKYDIEKYIFNFATNVPWNKLYNREFLVKHSLQYQAIRQANDTYFSIMALYFAERITCVDEALIQYRVNNQHSLSGKASETYMCAYDSYIYTLAELERQDDFARVKNSFQNRVLSGLIHSLNIQTEFDAYRKVYMKIQQEGIERFGFDSMKKEDAIFAWQLKELHKIKSTSPEDFVLEKAFVRRVSTEKLKMKNNILKERLSQVKQEKNFFRAEYKKEKKTNQKLMKQINTLKNKVDSIYASYSYRLGHFLLSVPRCVKKLLK